VAEVGKWLAGLPKADPLYEHHKLEALWLHQAQDAINEPLLKDLAASTGGHYFREENLNQLPDTISSKTERVQSPLEVELWASPLYFILMLMVITAEWVLRKMSHLK